MQINENGIIFVTLNSDKDDRIQYSVKVYQGHAASR